MKLRMKMTVAMMMTVMDSLLWSFYMEFCSMDIMSILKEHKFVVLFYVRESDSQWICASNAISREYIVIRVRDWWGSCDIQPANILFVLYLNLLMRRKGLMIPDKGMTAWWMTDFVVELHLCRVWFLGFYVVVTFQIKSLLGIRTQGGAILNRFDMAARCWMYHRDHDLRRAYLRSKRKEKGRDEGLIEQILLRFLWLVLIGLKILVRSE